jgi:hypothetical protein
MAPIDPNRVYSPDEAPSILGVSRGQVSVLIRDKVLLETTSRDGTWGLSGYSLLAEHRFRQTAPRWRKIVRRLWHDLPF